MKHLPSAILLLVYLAGLLYVVERLDFLEAWNRIKKVRVDRLEQEICE